MKILQIKKFFYQVPRPIQKKRALKQTKKTTKTTLRAKITKLT